MGTVALVVPDTALDLKLGRSLFHGQASKSYGAIGIKNGLCTSQEFVDSDIVISSL